MKTKYKNEATEHFFSTLKECKRTYVLKAVIGPLRGLEKGGFYQPCQRKKRTSQKARTGNEERVNKHNGPKENLYSCPWKQLVDEKTTFVTLMNKLKQGNTPFISSSDQKRT